MNAAESSVEPHLLLLYALPFPCIDRHNRAIESCRMAEGKTRGSPPSALSVRENDCVEPLLQKKTATNNLCSVHKATKSTKKIRFAMKNKYLSSHTYICNHPNTNYNPDP
jgi:hypothetical protein